MGRPFSLLEKNVPSMMVTINLSFMDPIETRRGLSNLSSNFRLRFERLTVNTWKERSAMLVESYAPL